MRNLFKDKRTCVSKESNYSIYVMTWKEWILLGVAGMFLVGIIAYLYFDTLYAGGILFVPGLWCMQRAFCKHRCNARRKNLKHQFREMMNALVIALNAGYSLENAVLCAKKDLQLLYSEKSDILQELEYILQQIKMNVAVEKTMHDFAKRAQQEDIYNFAQVIAVAKRNGGNLIQILQQSVDNINEKMEVEEEIHTMLAGKQYEQRIMSIMPVIIVAYMRFVNGAYMEKMYHNVFGIAIMGTCLCANIGIYIWSKKLVAIEV